MSNCTSPSLLHDVLCGLQKQHMRLQELYQQLKAQKITQLEGLLEEQVS
jgi:hypothetical protein